MVELKRSEIRQALANAHELAISNEEIPSNATFESLAATLTEDKCPKTYLAILAVLLTARAMFDGDELDVLQIKRGTASRGYSAPSIGSEVAVFAKDHAIDLRATSQQPLNNQPFTYEERIEKDMGVRPTLSNYWKVFFEAASLVNGFTKKEAADELAWLFRNRKAKVQDAKHYQVADFRRTKLLESIDDLASFIDSHSDAGRVGQAFASACFEVLYGPEVVVQGNAQDPDASKVGDVHVYTVPDGSPWLWVEVKQQPVQTGAILGFLQKVADSGGHRVVYLALKNSPYRSNIDIDKVERESRKKGMQVSVFQSPGSFLEYSFEISPGSFGLQLQHFLEAFDSRLVESGVGEGTLATFRVIGENLSMTDTVPKLTHG